MEYSVTGRTIRPGLSVDINVGPVETLGPCPGIFRAIVVASGSAITSIDGERLFLEAPEVLCLNGAEDVRLLKAEGLQLRAVYFRPHVVNSQLTRELVLERAGDIEPSPFRQDLFLLDTFVAPKPERRLVPLRPGALEHLQGLLDTLKRSLDEQADLYWPCRSRSFFIEFLFYLRNAAAPAADASSLSEGSLSLPADAPDKLEDILLYLHANYRGEISLPQLCKRFAINRTSLNELFKDRTGMTLISYATSLRIRLACLLLRDTTVPVKEIVWRTGFRDPVHFSRTFKARVGMTPGDYRKEYCFLLSS